MYLIPLAWLYVALMMGIAEATHPNGTVLGAIITFVLYGVGPVALVVYLMGWPARRRAIKAREAAQMTAARITTPPGQASQSSPDGTASGSIEPDAGSHAAADPVAPVRKEP